MADELLNDIKACQTLLQQQEQDNPEYNMAPVREMQAKSLWARLLKVHLSPAEATLFCDCVKNGGWSKQLSDGWIDNINASVCRRMSVKSMASTHNQLQDCSTLFAISTSITCRDPCWHDEIDINYWHHVSFLYVVECVLSLQWCHCSLAVLFRCMSWPMLAWWDRY